MGTGADVVVVLADCAQAPTIASMAIAGAIAGRDGRLMCRTNDVIEFIG